MRRRCAEARSNHRVENSGAQSAHRAFGPGADVEVHIEIPREHQARQPGYGIDIPEGSGNLRDRQGAVLVNRRQRTAAVAEATFQVGRHGFEPAEFLVESFADVLIESFNGLDAVGVSAETCIDGLGGAQESKRTLGVESLHHLRVGNHLSSR